jgi:hypothetical protein
MEKTRLLVAVRISGKELLAEFPTIKKAQSYVRKIRKEFPSSFIIFSGFEMPKATGGHCTNEYFEPLH